jgi:Fe-S-cluster containining protein
MNKAIQRLQKSYPSCYGTPVLSFVDTSIFVKKYFTRCLDCSFCHDWCCSDGVDLDGTNVQRILEHADELEKVVGVPKNRWFEDEVLHDPEMPGGLCYRTAVINGACVFLNRTNRGCLLQNFSEKKGVDYHLLKPLVSAIYPLTFDDEFLVPADEVDDDSLVCLGNGPTLYRGARSELEYYFGTGLIAELDWIEKHCDSIFTTTSGGNQ